MNIDKKVLRGLGIVFEKHSDCNAFLAVIQEELEVRIGTRISEGKTKEQLAAFDACHDSESTRQWLLDNAPDYRIIVEEEYCRMERELEEYKDYIKGLRTA